MTEPNERVYPSTTQGPTKFSSITHLGITKREYFAALMLQGFITSGFNGPGIAESAVRHADALIQELNKE